MGRLCKGDSEEVGQEHGDVWGCERQFYSLGALGRVRFPRFYEILINHTLPCDSSSLGITRGCQAAGWHECGRSAVKRVISCIIRVKSLEEWHAGQAHLVPSITVGTAVVPHLLSLLCLSNISLGGQECDLHLNRYPFFLHLWESSSSFPSKPCYLSMDDGAGIWPHCQRSQVVMPVTCPRSVLLRRSPEVGENLFYM